MYHLLFYLNLWAIIIILLNEPTWFKVYYSHYRIIVLRPYNILESLKSLSLPLLLLLLLFHLILVAITFDCRFSAAPCIYPVVLPASRSLNISFFQARHDHLVYSFIFSALNLFNIGQIFSRNENEDLIGKEINICRLIA